MDNMAAPLVYVLLLLITCRSVQAHGRRDQLPACYPSIFLFGDSLSDTGNGVISGNPALQGAAQSPYGKTFPGFPFNRFSDGRLIIPDFHRFSDGRLIIPDFLANALGLPFLNPYLDSKKDFSHGVNYAVAAATALDSDFLATKSVSLLTNLSIGVQLSWHLKFKASIADHRSGPGGTFFRQGLYVIEIGGNDYNSAFNSNYTPAVVRTMFVPLVVQKIRNITEALHKSGARNFLYIGITPLGCASAYLATNPGAAKDKDGCLSDFNLVAKTHGSSLLREVKELRRAHKDARFLFADYYNAYKDVLENNGTYGFTDALDACCGAGPGFPYNFNIFKFCNPMSDVCDNPNTRLNWDGIHFTDEFNRVVTNKFIDGSYLDPSEGLKCCASPVSVPRP